MEQLCWLCAYFKLWLKFHSVRTLEVQEIHNELLHLKSTRSVKFNIWGMCGISCTYWLFAKLLSVVSCLYVMLGLVFVAFPRVVLNVNYWLCLGTLMSFKMKYNEKLAMSMHYTVYMCVFSLNN